MAVEWRSSLDARLDYCKMTSFYHYQAMCQRFSLSAQLPGSQVLNRISMGVCAFTMACGLFAAQCARALTGGVLCSSRLQPAPIRQSFTLQAVRVFGGAKPSRPPAGVQYFMTV